MSCEKTNLSILQKVKCGPEATNRDAEADNNLHQKYHTTGWMIRKNDHDGYGGG